MECSRASSAHRRSTALLGILARTLLSPGLNAVTSERSFIVYRIATQAAGGQLIQVPMRRDTFDLDGIAAAAIPTPESFSVQPQQSHRHPRRGGSVDRFLNRLPEHVIVLDEAYYDFAQHFATQRGVDYSHSLNYVNEGRNVVVLRTFSKAHGLAGARVGYGIGSAELMAQHFAHRTMFCVSSLAQAGALAALED